MLGTDHKSALLVVIELTLFDRDWSLPIVFDIKAGAFVLIQIAFHDTQDHWKLLKKGPDFVCGYNLIAYLSGTCRLHAAKLIVFEVTVLYRQASVVYVAAEPFCLRTRFIISH